MMPSVLVTGGAGLLGVNWAASIRDRCAVTLGLHEREIELRKTRSTRLSLESVDVLQRILDRLDCSLVIHTAGMTNVEACESEPERARYANIDLAVNVAKACARSGSALVHISTDHLFGDERAVIEEEDPVSPTNVYGHTKAEAEVRVLDEYPAALVVRTNFYGWGPRYRRSFSDFIVDSLRRGARTALFRDVSYAPILMEALITAVHDLVDSGARGIYHVVGDDHVTKYEFGMRLAGQFGLDSSLIDACSIDDKPWLVARPRSMNLSNSKARSALDRPLGGIQEHLVRLQEQERSDTVREIRSL
jgi:dTDP-4-dehydrorhamnose reductase